MVLTGVVPARSKPNWICPHVGRPLPPPSPAVAAPALPRLPSLLSLTPAPGSAGGVCRVVTRALSMGSLSPSVTQGLAQREQQWLRALCLACRDPAALRNDEPGLSPAERGLRHRPEIRVGWEALTGREPPAPDQQEQHHLRLAPRSSRLPGRSQPKLLLPTFPGLLKLAGLRYELPQLPPSLLPCL